MGDLLYNDSKLQMESRLILCLEEHDAENINSPVDTRLFIGWDSLTNEFYVKGRRQDTQISDYVPFSFRFRSTIDVYEFVVFVMGKKDTTSIILYNYNNMSSLYDEELTYEFFQDNLDKNYEIAGYDSMKLNINLFIKLLGLLSRQIQVNQK
jgi:hypothetical protein